MWLGKKGQKKEDDEIQTTELYLRPEIGTGSSWRKKINNYLFFVRKHKLSSELINFITIPNRTNQLLPAHVYKYFLCLFDYSFLFVTLQKVKTKQEHHETRRKSKSPREMSHVFAVLLKVTKALINGSLRSLYFLNFVNDRAIPNRINQLVSAHVYKYFFLYKKLRENKNITSQGGSQNLCVKCHTFLPFC